MADEWRAAMKPTLGMSLWAVRDAPAASGRFPVVIYAPSFSHVSWENADLCEYLASHGYVVIASPDMGATTRSMTLDLTGIHTQARDISFLVAYAAGLTNTDASRVAVAGYSWGGISNLFAAARDSRIRALVDLDGSMRYYPGLVKQAGDVHPEQMTLPLLFFAQREFSFEDEERYVGDDQLNNPSVLNAWTHGDLVFVHMLGLTHAEFSSMHQRNEDMWWELFHVWPMWQGDYDREDAMTAYNWVARYTLAFLDAYLKKSPDAVGFLRRTPAENGVPRHAMAISYRAAEGVPPTFESFRAEVGQRGFDHADEVYAAFRKEKSDFTLGETVLSSWAQELIDTEHLPEAIDILKLAAQLYPTSSDRYVDLGDAYLRSGQKRLALENYRASLEKDANNGTARRKLAQFETGTVAAAAGRAPVGNRDSP
jgi:dienelactone hydrolase